MGLLDGFEKLINEHGSSVILKERISLANDKHSILESENSNLKQKVLVLESKNEALGLNLGEAKEKIRKLEKQISDIHNINPNGYVCDHCGSSSLKRTGSRSDPTFGELGVKQKIFTCNECEKESAFTPPDSEL